MKKGDARIQVGVIDTTGASITMVRGHKKWVTRVDATALIHLIRLLEMALKAIGGKVIVQGEYKA